MIQNFYQTTVLLAGTFANSLDHGISRPQIRFGNLPAIFMKSVIWSLYIKMTKLQHYKGKHSKEHLFKRLYFRLIEIDSPTWPSRYLVFSMLRTWWLPVTPVTAGTSPWLLSSGAECLWRKLTSRCLEFKIRTQATLSNGSLTTSRPLPVTFLQESWRWLPPLMALPRGSVNSSLPCSRERFVDLLISS